MSSLISRYRGVARDAADKVAIITDTRRITYAELDQEVDAYVAELRHAGLRAGEAVAVEGVNVIGFVAAYLAIVASGGCVVPIDARSSAAEVAATLEESRPYASIVFRPDGELARHLAEHLAPDAELLGRVLVIGEHGTQVTRVGDAVVHHSSGSTGLPKGIVLTVDNIFHKVSNWNATLETTSSDVFLCTLTLSHCFGMYVHTLAALLAGATVVMPDLATITPRRIASLIEQHSVTIFGSLPYMFQALLALPAERLKLDRVRFAISGSAPLPLATAQAFRARFGRPINQVYGLTEIGLVTFDKVGDDVASIGRFTHGMRAKVIDANGRECGAGESGELVVFCESMARGYLNSPEDQQAMFRDGWLWTKDIAELSTDGRVYLRGRTSQFVNVGGNKVAPSEVEGVLLAHGDVAEAAVLGRRTTDGGEEVIAFVVMNRSTDSVAIDDLFRFCSERLAAYKLPREILVRATLPKSPLGKVLKTQLLS